MVNRIKQILINIIFNKNNAPFLIKNNKNIISGKKSFHNGNFFVKGKNKVIIGNYCAFGSDIKFITSNHNYDYMSIQYSLYNNLFSKKPYELKSSQVSIEVGSDVWIGDNVIILPNVKIGHGSIIACGSIVTKDVESYSIYGGVPGVKIKNRFTSEIKEELLELKWWEWSDTKIKNNKDLFFKNFNSNEK